jgi:hypothetical protein
MFCRASLSCQVSMHLPWFHNFRFQSLFQILLAENFHNFFVQIFCILFPILFAGLVSSGCEGFMVPSFLHCFVSSSTTFWPCLSVRRSWQATDCSSLFLRFFSQVLEVFGTLSCSRILCWRFPPPLVAEDEARGCYRWRKPQKLKVGSGIGGRLCWIQCCCQSKWLFFWTFFFLICI